MKIEITAQPIFWIEFDVEQLTQLLKLSANHYDSVCKTASKPGGFLLGWYNSAMFCQENPEESPYMCRATFREVNTVLKILESVEMYITNPDEIKQMNEVGASLRDAIHHTQTSSCFKFKRIRGSINWYVAPDEQGNAG